MTTTLTKIDNKLHAPFALRKIIAFAGLLVAAGFYVLNFFSKDVFVLSLSAYMVTVVLLDVAMTLLKRKPSHYADPVQLLKSEKVTPKQLDAYYQSRLYIRLSSCLVALSAATVGYFLGYPFEAFAGTYVVATLIGIVSVRVFSDLVFPKLLYKRSLTAQEMNSGISYAQALALSYGLTGKFDNPFASGQSIR